MSTRGHQQAREVGIFLDSLLAEEGISADRITWLSSPFLRTLQTSNEALNVFEKTKGAEQLKILPEYSVFAWDGKGGEWHKSLPPIEERTHYFPRLDHTYQSLFVPTIPEPRTKFHGRCDRAIQSINKRFPYSPRTAIIVVTHAAACIGLARSAANVTLQDITPAGPCSVYRLTRTSNSQVWVLDPHDTPGSLNGHTDHLSDLGGNTVPWNNFGDKKINRGYTGPPKSRFAPPEVRNEL